MTRRRTKMRTSMKMRRRKGDDNGEDEKGRTNYTREWRTVRRRSKTN